MNYICRIPSPAGMLAVSSDGINITGLWFERMKRFADASYTFIEKELPVFEGARDWLGCYFSGREPEFILPALPEGTEFRQSVWKITCGIPYGQVKTYGEVAELMEKQTGKRAAARSVGTALSHNPVLIIIPCHRVIGADGRLTGYSGGIEIKKSLLKLENGLLL